MPTVTTPNPRFRGVRGGLHFVDGKASSDEPLTARQRRFFASVGYAVDDGEDTDAEAEDVPEADVEPDDHDGHTVAIPPERPTARASREDWDVYAASIGLDLTGLSTKDDVRAAVEALEAEASPEGEVADA